ncbi:MAG: hypothetical protein H0Z38_08020 [Firmicutes bacterium]|nr:hypothetical protein [Bacillota bacterium]
MALSALNSVKAAEKKAEEIVANARKEANQIIRDASAQRKEIVAKSREEAEAKGKALVEKAEQEAQAEAATIHSEAAEKVGQILGVSKSKQEAVLAFVAEGIVKRYVSGSHDQNCHSNT